MIRLYHCVDARSFRPLWALEEVGAPYELVVLPFPPRVLEKSFLEINALGTIPALIDGDTVMTESAAIVEYLALRHGDGDLAVANDHPEFGRYLNYLHFGEATLTFPQTLVLRYSRLEPRERRQPQVAEDYRKWFLARLRGVERALAGRTWLCAERFTGADISVGYALLLAQSLGIDDAFAGPVGDYWERLQARDSFQRAKAAQSAGVQAAGIGPTFRPA
jgi:glutathione S-transferase